MALAMAGDTQNVATSPTPLAPSGAVQPKLRTIRLIQRFWQERGIAFEDLANGGRLVVDSAVI